MDFHSMKRKELQELCKNHGIPANLTNVEMANRISSIFKGSEKEKPLICGRSCLKAVDEGVCQNDSDGVNRKFKKVRFCHENELIEFTKSIAKRGRRKKSGTSNSYLTVENVCSVDLKQTVTSSPVRVTRSRGQKLLDAEDAEKKVIKRGLNGNNRVEKLSSLSDNEVRVATRRALRNREKQDEGLRESEGVIQGLRKSERQRNWGSAKGIENVPQSKQSGEEPQDACRRSKRNAAKKEDISLVHEEVGKHENSKGGRLGRNQALSEVKASVLETNEVRSAQNDLALTTGDNKEVGVITRRSLRNKEITEEGKQKREDDNEWLRRSGRQSKRGPLGSHEVLQSQDIVEEPKKELRRSKRNVTNVKDAVTLDENKNFGKVRLGRNQITLAVKTSKLEAGELKIADDSIVSSNVSNCENRACTKRSLRNKKVAVSEDVNEGLKKIGGQISLRNVKSSEEGPQNKQIEEEVNKALRRSKRSAAKMDDSQCLYKSIGKSKMVRKERITGSHFAIGVEASILEAMSKTELAASENNEEGKEPAKASIRSSPQNLVMPLLEKATKEMEASSFTAQSETEAVAESRLEVFIQVEEPTSASRRSSSFDAPFETEIAAESRLGVVNQVEERTNASPRRATGQNSGITLLENVRNVHQNMNQNLSSYSTRNASPDVEVFKDDEMSQTDGLRRSMHKTGMFYSNASTDEQVDSSKAVANSELTDNSSKTFEEPEGPMAEKMRTPRRNASTQDHVNSSDGTGKIHNATANSTVEKESCSKKSNPAEICSQQLRANASSDDKNVQPVGKDNDAGNQKPLNVSKSRNMALRVSLAEDMTKINEQCTQVALLSGTTDTEITKEPASPEPLTDESCLIKNEYEETSHQKNQVSPHKVGDRTGEVQEVKPPQLVGGVGNSCSDLVDLHTNNEVQIVDIPVTESKCFAEMVNISMVVNVENSLDDLVVANLAEQEPSEDFNVDRDSASVEANSTIDCYRSNSQSYLTAGVKEMQRKELTEIDHAESASNEEEISVENELVVIAESLNQADGEKLAAKVYLAEDRTSNREKKSLQIGDCTQVAILSSAEVTDILNEPVNDESFIDDTVMNRNKFEESAQQIKQVSSPKVGNRKEMEEVKSPELVNAFEESRPELVTSHTDHVEQEKVLVNELKDFSNKVNISLEENTEKSLGCFVGHNLVHCKTYDGINVDRDTVPFEINSPTKAYGCINQSDLTADVKKQSEEVAELQYAGSLSKDIGSTFQLVEHAVKDELSGEKKQAVVAADNIDSFATMMVSNDVLQDSLDDRPGENVEDGSRRFEETGFVDSSAMYKCGASILEVHAVDAGNAEHADAGYVSITEQFSPFLNKDLKKALEPREQLSSKLRNSIKLAFVVEGDEVFKGDLQDQVNAPDNDGRPSVTDANRRSETSLQEVRGSNGEKGCVNNVEIEHFPPSESKLPKHGAEIHSQRIHHNGLETGIGLCECEDGSDGTETVPGVLDLESSYSGSPSKCNDAEEQEEQLRLLFSTPINDESTCEENAKACSMDSNKTSGQFTDVSSAGEELRNLFTTCGDVLCPDGNDKCSHQSANISGLERHRCLSDCEYGSDSIEQVSSILVNDTSHCGTPKYRNGKDQEDQLRLLFSTPTSVRSTGKEKAKAFTMDSNTMFGQLIEASNTVHTALDDNKTALNNDSKPEQGEVRKLFTTNDDCCADGKDKFSFPNGDSNGLETDRAPSECKDRSNDLAILVPDTSNCVTLKFDDDKKEDQLELPFSKSINCRSTGDEISEAFCLDSDTSDQLIEASKKIQNFKFDGYKITLNDDKGPEQGKEFMKSFTTSDATSADEKKKCTYQNDSTCGVETDRVLCECIGKFDGLEQGTTNFVHETSHYVTPWKFTVDDRQEGPLRFPFSTPNSVRGTDEESAKDLYMDSSQRSGQLIEATNAAQTVLDDDILHPMLALNNGKEHGQELQENDLPGNVDTDREEIGKFAEPLGAHGNFPCLLSTPFQEKCEVAKEKGIETEGSNNCSDNVITKSKVADCLKESIEVCREPKISSEVVVVQGGFVRGDISQELKMRSTAESREDGPLKNNTDIYPCAEMSHPSSFELVEPQESSARTALHVNESGDPSTEENECRAKAAEMELYTSEPCLKPTHQFAAEIDLDVDKGRLEDPSLSLEKNGSIEKQNAADTVAGNSLFFGEFNSLSRKNDTRSILIHATPYKQPVRVDMKENTQTAKGELIGTLTAARPKKRRPLKDLQWK